MEALLSIAFALLAGLMMSRLVKRWHLPAVTAYLVAGVLIGPNCLGLLGIPGIGFASFDYVASFSLICDVALGFIAFSTLMMVILGNAAALLIIAGAFNGLILPVTLGVMLFAGHKASIVGSEYKHPMWLTILGAIVVVIALYSGVQAVPGIMALFG